MDSRMLFEPKHAHKRRTRPTRARITKVVSNAHAVISHNVYVSERHAHVTCIEHALLSDDQLPPSRDAVA